MNPRFLRLVYKFSSICYFSNIQVQLVCGTDGCSTTFEITKDKSISQKKFRLHKFHHRTVRPGTLPWPCDKCDFATAIYEDWVAHRNKNHPKFTFYCRFPGCDYQTYDYRYRRNHWRDTHMHVQNEAPVCEVSDRPKLRVFVECKDDRACSGLWKKVQAVENA